MINSCLTLISLFFFFNSFNDIQIIDLKIKDLDNDNLSDSIIITYDRKLNEDGLIINLSTLNKTEPFCNNKNVIPDFYNDYILVDEIEIDSIGFNLLYQNTNGNNHKSKRFFFKYHKNDIVLYRIEEIRFYDANFIQEENITSFVYENRILYDSSYSLRYFDYRKFW